MSSIETGTMPIGPNGETDPSDYMIAGTGQDLAKQVVSSPMVAAPASEASSVKAASMLAALSVTKKLTEMEAMAMNTNYIFKDLCQNGTMSLFYASPNTGKTLLFLWLLIEAIKDGRADAQKIFYINADDNFMGLLEKGRIAEKYGFNMISPQQAGKSPDEVVGLLVRLARGGDAEGVLIVLDTLKKFTDMLNKRANAELFQSLREVTTAGGTVIIAGHANKNPDANGDLVYEGTGDIKADVDNMFSIYALNDRSEGEQVIEVRCEKDRGKVKQRESFRYKKSPTIEYHELVASIERVSNAEATTARRAANDAKTLAKYEDENDFIIACLKDREPLTQSDLVKAREQQKDSLSFGRGKLIEAVKRLNGVSVVAVNSVSNNAKMIWRIESSGWRQMRRG